MEVDCNATFAEAVDNLAERIEQVGATVTRGDLPTVRGERALLTAVFQNLIGNAIKFVRPGVAPIVTVDARPDPSAPMRCGRSPSATTASASSRQYVDRVFTIFQRLHAKEEYEGTGIGLALCRKIVEDHGGLIWIVDRTDPARRSALPFRSSAHRGRPPSSQMSPHRAHEHEDRRDPVGRGRSRRCVDHPRSVRAQPADEHTSTRSATARRPSRFLRQEGEFADASGGRI